ncbi:MAG: peptidase M50 [Microbacteriaceae bacterium]|nr:peptidase M50 [Burkholderiaceae bacterium]
MSDDAPLQSSLWYRIAALKPRLLARAKLHRHRYRGELWYLLQDPASGKVHRFTPQARLLIAAMDGQRTVDEIWRLAQRELGDGAPTQDEVLQLLGQLHGADLLQTDVTPDAVEVFERGQKEERTKSRRSWANPLSLKLSLVDPGAFLDRHVGLWQLIWSRWGGVLWLATMLPALVLLPSHLPELTNNLSDRVLQADNLFMLALVFPLIKALHEMGHATATRAAGGEVHDMGLMLLVLLPVPYVDASASTVLRSRWSRALIGAAGMVVELFIAALAFYVWLAVEPGLLRAACFNIMLVAGVSTLVFNGNPLLRYDAYYILADLIEVPNLARQSARYWGYLGERYLLRMRDSISPAISGAERLWFALYGLASTAYRLFVTVAIALFIGGQFFFFGVIMALWSVVSMLGLPLYRVLKQFGDRTDLRERRRSAFGIGGLVVTLLLLVVVMVPVSYRTQAEGVLWLPEQAIVRAGASGFVSALDTAPGTPVQQGQVLVRSSDAALEAQVRLAEARVAEQEANYLQEFVNDRSRAEIVARQLALEREALATIRNRATGLLATAATDGVFSMTQPDDAPGRYHRQGEVLGYVLGQVQPIVRVVVEQGDADAVVTQTRSVSLRLADDLSSVLAARVARAVPAAAGGVPSGALVSSGGGRLASDPRDPQGRRTLQSVFVVDVEPLGPLPRAPAYGQRVHVRFDHEPRPLAMQWYASLRRLFMSHFSV